MASARAWQPRPGAWSSSVAARKAARNLPRNTSITTTTADTLVTSSHSKGRYTRNERLPGKEAYGRVFADARRSHDRWFTVLYRANGRRRPRLGLAIAKKHCRLATGRNRLKRLVRESFRQHQASLGGIDIVVMNKPGAERVDNRRLFDSLADHWQRCRSKERNGR